MANALNTFVDLICDKCKSEYQITLDLQKRRVRNNTPNLCRACMKEKKIREEKERWTNKSPKELEAWKNKKKEEWATKSIEEKEAHAQRSRDQFTNRDPEKQAEINKKNSEGLKKHWKTVSKKDRDKRVKPMLDANAKRWEDMTPEERSAAGLNWTKFKTEEEIKEILNEYSKRMSEYNESISLEEKQDRAAHMNEVNATKSSEEKVDIYRRSHQWYYDLDDEGKFKYAEEKCELYNNLSDEEKIIHSKKSSTIGSISSLHPRFENAFNSSHLVNDYYFIGEFITNNEIVHRWDYAIFDKSSNELVMLVDIDGQYHHADNNDYNGNQSKEERDEKRILSIPKDSNITPFIIQENKFTKCFELMLKTLMMNYDEYVKYTFKMCRSMPFPNPSYSDKELINSFKDLCNMKTDDKYHRSISLNTRNGDRLITHFHPSIYQAHRKEKISPYDAWYDDDILKKCIQNRIIYQNYLNPNKILQGFNISKVATKVSTFSAGRAKMLISKYLSDFNEVFDPFSGFSGRMLGTISLGKRYIGQDISDIHVRESNNMIKFLDENIKWFDIDNIDTNIECKDILDSSGEYECLFTCPPYEDIEQWLDVPVSKRTCDEWIDECLKRFKCKKYLFVVDNNIEKYKDYVVDTIRNKSHFGYNGEYVVLIER